MMRIAGSQFAGRFLWFGFKPKSIVLLCLVLVAWTSSLVGNPNVQLANLKQDMELVSRELAGLRTEVELLRRENAQLRVSVEQLTRRQNSTANDGDTKQDTRLQALENRATRSEKEQVALQKNIDKKFKELIAEMNKVISQVNKPSGGNFSPTPSFSDDYPQKGFVHKVERGETVSSIAQKHKSRIKWIIDANQIADPTKVFVGKELFVPQK